ncbi:UNVERIFIED_CONTAM: hypothetical protein FKN15_046770 [Acipenser sinensis]
MPLFCLVFSIGFKYTSSFGILPYTIEARVSNPPIMNFYTLPLDGSTRLQTSIRCVSQS